MGLSLADADIEARVLSGELFNGPSRSSSPARSIEADDEDPGWEDDDEHKIEFGQGLDEDPDERGPLLSKEQEMQVQQSIGMGPGRTGVKGVIRDRNEADQIRRDMKAKEMEEMKQRMEGMSLGGKTFLEEEREKALRGEKADKLVSLELDLMQEKMVTLGGNRPGKFGHLREVGLNGYISAIEKEDRNVWVVVHLYEPSLDRCYLIDEKLSRLAREFPDVKFLRVRAAALGFASLKSKKPKTSLTRQKRPSHDDDDDPYADIVEDERNDPEEEDDDIDLDMLPTMLVYQNGDLVYNWVRVDWEAGEAELEELLERHHILSGSQLLGSHLFSDSELEFA